MIEKLNVKRICAVESYKYISDSVYYSKPNNTLISYDDYHPLCHACAYLFSCPYSSAKTNYRYGKETLCMKYVHYNSFNYNLVYLKYNNDNSRRRYTLMTCGIPYEYDKTLV